MTTFEGIIYGLVHGLTEFLPVGAGGHLILIPSLFNVSEPGPLMGALYLGALLAVLVYFRHDWASMISSFLQILIYRKYPMTVDERMPLFMLIATLPVAISWYYFQPQLAQALDSPIRAAAGIAGFGLILAFADAFGRKSKGTFDWNWLDALAAGVFQLLVLIPGCGATTGILCGSLLRNYRREPAVKFALYCSAPLLTAGAVVHLRAAEPLPGAGLSWITFSVTTLVTLFAGLLAIGGLMKQIERKGFRAYVAYRLLIGIGAIAWLTWNG